MKKLRWSIAQFFEKRWWKGYLHKKNSTAYLSWKKNYWQLFLKELNLSIQDIHAPIIDIGCGPAGIFMLFNQQSVDALDPLLSSYYDLAVFDKNRYPTTQFIETAFEDFETIKTYQTVFCLNAINHFVDLEKSVLKLQCIADNNARVIVSIDAHNHKLLKYFFRLFPFDILHPHQLDLADYIQLFGSNGFALQQKKCFKKEFIFSYWVLELKG